MPGLLYRVAGERVPGSRLEWFVDVPAALVAVAGARGKQQVAVALAEACLGLGCRLRAVCRRQKRLTFRLGAARMITEVDSRHILIIRSRFCSSRAALFLYLAVAALARVEVRPAIGANFVFHRSVLLDCICPQAGQQRLQLVGYLLDLAVG